LGRGDHSFRGVLPALSICLCVCVRERDLETPAMRWPRPDFACCAAENSGQYIFKIPMSTASEILFNAPFSQQFYSGKTVFLTITQFHISYSFMTGLRK
jgi:hypothetical protein